VHHCRALLLRRVPLLMVLAFRLAVLAEGQTPSLSVYSPKDVVQMFCSMDQSGKQLTPGGAKKIAGDLLVTERSIGQTSEVVIIRNYSLGDLRLGKSDAEVQVEYSVLGRIDSSLQFARVQTAYGNQPVLLPEHFSLVWTDTHSVLNRNGMPQALRGTPEWRIKTAPLAPHVSVEAAIEYVRGASNRTRDALIKARAQKTLADLEVLAQFQSMPIQGAGTQQQPEDILSQFAQMQMDGAGLASGGSSELGIFLVHPAQWRQDKIGVARGFGVRRTSFAVNKAEAYVQYEALGEIDLRLRFSGSGASGTAVRQNYKLIFDNDYSSVPNTSNDPYARIGPSRWRIDGAPDEQWVSIATAIKYVTQMRDLTPDPAIRANADKTLAILAHYR